MARRDDSRNIQCGEVVEITLDSGPSATLNPMELNKASIRCCVRVTGATRPSQTATGQRHIKRFLRQLRLQQPLLYRLTPIFQGCSSKSFAWLCGHPLHGALPAAFYQAA